MKIKNTILGKVNKNNKKDKRKGRGFISSAYVHFMALSKIVADRHLDVYSAGTAFYLFISLIPLFIAILSIVPYTPITQNEILSLAKIFPDDIGIVFQVVTAEAYVKSATRLWIALLLALWSAARGVMFMSKGLNEISSVKERRNYFVVRFWSALYTFLIVVAVVVLMIMGIFGKKILQILRERMPLIQEKVNIPIFTILSFRGLIVVVALFMLFLFLYTVLPNKRMKIRHQLPGAVLCAILWWMFTKVFSLAVDKVGGFSMYGSMATVISGMLWLYFCVYIMFLCAELNNYLTFRKTLNRINGE